MSRTQVNKSRFIVGLVLVAVAVWLFLTSKEAYAVAIGVLGLVSIAISRRN